MLHPPFGTMRRQGGRLCKIVRAANADRYEEENACIGDGCEGNAWLDRNFPKLDSIVKARVE